MWEQSTPLTVNTQVPLHKVGYSPVHFANTTNISGKHPNMSGFYWHPQAAYNIDTIYNNEYGIHVYWCSAVYSGTKPNIGGNQIVLICHNCGGSNYQAQYAISFGGGIASRTISNGKWSSWKIFS